MVLHSPPGGEKSLDELTKLATPVTSSRALLLTNAKVYSTKYLCLVFEFQFQHLLNPCTLFIGVPEYYTWKSFDVPRHLRYLLGIGLDMLVESNKS